jgi:fructose-bisphosphate aldolase class II
MVFLKLLQIKRTYYHFSNGGTFNAGLSNAVNEKRLSQEVAGALHIHTLAEAYGTVILHTDHCAKKLLPWIDGLLDASENILLQRENHCSVHMIDLSEEPIEEISEICKGYLV